MIKFKIKLNIKKYNIEYNIESIINCPVIFEKKCIGIITNYNVNTDEATGVLFNNLSFNFNNNQVSSIEIIN